MVTNKFPDGNFSRPRLGVFAFAQRNKNIPAPGTQADNLPQGRFICLVCPRPDAWLSHIRETPDVFGHPSLSILFRTLTKY